MTFETKPPGRKGLLNRKFLLDMIWTYGSLAIMVGSGLGINLLLLATSGPRAVGVFNQIFAYYVVLSQLAVGGVHHSTLKHVAHLHPESTEQISIISFSALLLAACLGAAVWGGSSLAAGLIGRAADSPDLGEGLSFAAPGLALLSINKVQLALLNGLRYMKAFAALQSLRSLVLIASIALVALRGWDLPFMGLAFTAAELVVVLGAIPLVWQTCRPLPSPQFWPWVKKHAGFGARGLLSGIFLVASIRTDVLVLGFFFNDVVVGVYSLAATFSEGFYSLLHAIRLNVNPLLPPLLAGGRLDEVRHLTIGLQYKVYPGALAAGVLLLLAFPLVMEFLDSPYDYGDAWLLLMILIGGLVISSGTIPLDFIFLQAGRPGTHSLFMLSLFGSNLILNLVLIQFLGYFGAAWATAASFILSLFSLRGLVRLRLGFSLPIWPWGFRNGMSQQSQQPEEKLKGPVP